jgi:chemotaxis regulatin CheY-phosphate phosphatase CheZ
MSLEKLEALADAIAKVCQLLSQHGDKWVVERMSELEARLMAGDQSAVVSAVSESTGSMGSLRDRFLCPENGDQIEPSDVNAVNERLSGFVREVEARARDAAAQLGIALLR